MEDCKLVHYLSAAVGVCTVLSTRICDGLGYAGVALAVLALIIPSLLTGKAESTILKRVTGSKVVVRPGGGVSLWYCCDWRAIFDCGGLLPEVG